MSGPAPDEGVAASGALSEASPWVATRAGKIGMWVFIATDAMGFGGLLLAYAALRVRAPAWPDPAGRFDLGLAAALTFVLLASGATMSAAVAAARDGRYRAARILVALTALAGIIFVAGQASEFHTLASGHHVGLVADHAAALFYVIAGYHGLHVLVGVVVLATVGAGRARQAGPADRSAPPPDCGALEVAALYWQFVDAVWIVLFTVLYLVPPVMHGR